MSVNKNAQAESGLSVWEVRHPRGCDPFFRGSESSDQRIDVLGTGPIGNAICWLNCYHSFPQKVFVGRKLIRCFSLVNTFAKNNCVPSSHRNHFVLVQKMICRFGNSPIQAIEKIKRSNYAAFSLVAFSIGNYAKRRDRKTRRKNMPAPG